MSGRIRGAQIKDDSVTGDDVNESTLILPQAYHSSGDHNSTSIVYLAIPGRNGWSTNFLKREHQLIAPYDGTVTKVLIRPQTGDSLNGAYFQVRTNEDGNTCEDGEDGVVTTTKLCTLPTSEGTTEVVLNPATGEQAPIPKGHAFCFALLKLTGGGYRYTDAVIVIEWDLSS
jgi:hypothetical protein